MRRLRGAEDEFVPVLQIIHLSDLHFGPSKPGVAVIGRQAANSLGAQVGDWIMRHSQGFAGHDANALFQLEAVLKRIVQRTRTALNPYQGCPFRLVVTGDLSTWGDEASIRHCMDRVTDLARAVGLSEPPIFIYGNHDVWPGAPGRPEGFPLFVRNEKLDAKRTSLRHPNTGLFRATWPRHLAEQGLPFTTSSKLTLRSLNTVLHDRVANTLAQGHVGPDRYWEGSRDPDQHVVVDQGCAPGIRIVLTHHPVHDPSGVQLSPPLPLGNGRTVALAHRTLTNARDVASSLSMPQTGVKPGWRRRVQVVLSGHTHETFPEFGKLEGVKDGQRHPPLEEHQVQLTAGSACQSPWTARAKPQEWQLLRFSVSVDGIRSADPLSQTVLRIERSVFTRWTATGRFVARRLPSGSTFEQLHLQLR